MYLRVLKVKFDSARKGSSIPQRNIWGIWIFTVHMKELYFLHVMNFLHVRIGQEIPVRAEADTNVKGLPCPCSPLFRHQIFSFCPADLQHPSPPSGAEATAFRGLRLSLRPILTAGCAVPPIALHALSSPHVTVSGGPDTGFSLLLTLLSLDLTFPSPPVIV